MILKQSDGNKGKNNFLVPTSDELQRLLAEHSDVRFVAQQYIPNDGDVRVITHDKTFLLAIGRSSDGSSHLHNVSLGATPTLLDETDIDGKILADCFEAARLMHRELSGMDVMRSSDTGKWYILESNNMPQLMSGAFAEEKAGKLADVFAARLSGEL
jgi:glutathione synthase/RimK-type ligase-like ATP-grasp enzyme